MISVSRSRTSCDGRHRTAPSNASGSMRAIARVASSTAVAAGAMIEPNTPVAIDAGVAPLRIGARRASTHASAVVVPSSPNAGLVSHSTSDRVNAGSASARWRATIPPIDSPTTCAAPPPKPVIQVAAAPARASNVHCDGGALTP